MLRIRFVMGNYKLPTGMDEMIYTSFSVLISETARTYDPESDMTVVVGVPTYYSEESRMMIRFDQLVMKVNFVNNYCVCMFAGLVTALAKLDFKY